MDKRRFPRYKRRLHLRFWSPEERTPRKGFTQNVSVSGMFIATSTPFKPGSRVFVEIPHGGERLVLQGEVRYAAKVDPMLQKVRPSGMGVRLLRVDEVMAEILRIKKVEIEEVVAVQGAAGTTAEAQQVEATEESAFPVTFQTPHELTTAYERDIKYGGLFVASPEPAEKDDRVMVEFLFDWDPERTVKVQAQVVKKFASAEGSVAGEAVTGMGVAFVDPGSVMAQFGDVISSLGQTQQQDKDER